MKYTLYLLLLFSNSTVCAQTIVKLTKSNGVYKIPCEINGKSTLFYFDSGASDVSLSLNFYNEAIKNGSLKKSDLLPEIVNYQVANGNNQIGRQINIRELKIGNLVLNNVLGSITENESSPLLLGQSALERFGSYKINNANSTITIEGNYKSDIDLALKAAKEKAIDQMKSSGHKVGISIIQNQIQQTKVDILRDSKIAAGLEFEVSKIEFQNNDDGEFVFKYDITNNSGIDYKHKALSQLYIFIDVFTKEGKVYSSSTNAEQMLAGNTVNGQNLVVKLRNKTPIYFRLYGIVNGPLLSTIER